MSAALDKRLKKASNVIWQTVEKDGRKWTLQVCICPATLERLVANAIEEKTCSHVFTDGPAVISLTRQL